MHVTLGFSFKYLYLCKIQGKDKSYSTDLWQTMKKIKKDHADLVMFSKQATMRTPCSHQVSFTVIDIPCKSSNY